MSSFVWIVLFVLGSMSWTFWRLSLAHRRLRAIIKGHLWYLGALLVVLIDQLIGFIRLLVGLKTLMPRLKGLWADLRRFLSSWWLSLLLTLLLRIIPLIWTWGFIFGWWVLPGTLLFLILSLLRFSLEMVKNQYLLYSF